MSDDRLTILITGSNRGIGLALTQQFSERGDRVIACCRVTSSALEQLAEQKPDHISILSGIEVTHPGDVEERLIDIGVNRLDVLINNAGILVRESFDTLDAAQIERQFSVNAVAPILVTRACRNLLGEGSKVANITSRMGSIADNTSGGMYGYRMSKAALNMATASLALDLKPSGIAVACLHPGYVRTDMTNQNGLINSTESATGLIARIDDLSLKNTGGFWHCSGERLPW